MEEAGRAGSAAADDTATFAVGTAVGDAWLVVATAGDNWGCWTVTLNDITRH